MKKLFTLLTISFLCLAANSKADNFIVSNASDPDLNGLYIEAGTYNGKPYYDFDDNYGISWDGSMWEMGALAGGGFIWSTECTDASTSATCPTSGWSCTELTVAPQGDGLSYSTTRLIESDNNDGSLPGSVVITLNAVSPGQAFTGPNGSNYAGNKLTFGTLPAGLTPHAVKTDSTITLTFTGAATNNNHADDTYITFQFADSAFANDTAANVSNYIDSVQIIFRQEFTVASTGADFTTVAGALAAVSDYDIISISGETFTEAGLAVTKAVIIKGQGADQTIIQANASYNTASDRVFNVSAADTVVFQDLTITNGKVTAGNGEGGGIYSQSTPVNVYRCALTNNIAISSASGSAFGGAIYCPPALKVVASLISGNTAHSVTGFSYGGGIFCYNFTVVNSTVTGDTASGPSSPNLGGGIFTNGGTSSAINCTITNNTANSGGSGLGFYNGPVVTLVNTIVYGNSGGDDVAAYNNSGGVLNVSNAIMGATSTAAINGIDYNVSTADPLLSPLANNGGHTLTMALNTGSFAINEGSTGDSIPATDQRGYGANGIRDIGAFEYEGIPPCVPNGDSAAAAICNGDSIFLGGAYQMTAGTFYDTLTNVGGCDSVIVTTLAVNRVNISTATASICMGDSIFLGGAYQTIANTYYDPLRNIYGCDSVIITNLTVNPIDSSTEIAFICSGDSIMFDGVELKTAGIHYVTLTNSVTGCDSIDGLNLVVDTLNLSVTTTGDTLNALQLNATSYQWIDCSNSDAAISGEMNPSYIASASGSFAVIITNGACYDTTSCQPVVITGVEQLPANKDIVIYPNPASTVLTVTNIKHLTTIRLYDILGKLAFEEETVSDLIISTSKLTSGLYTLVADDGKERSFNKVMITK